MADCQALATQLSNIQSNYDAQVRGIISYQNFIASATSSSELDAIIEEIKSRKETLQIVVIEDLLRLAQITPRNECPQTSINVSTLINKTDFAISRANAAISSAESSKNTLSAENAASKENNAGTGTPGTAGQGAGATPAQPTDPTVITDTNAVTSADPNPIADPTTLPAGSDPSVATQQFDIGGGIVIDVPSGADSDPAVPTQQFDIGGGITLDVPSGAPSASGSAVGLQGAINKTQSIATAQDQSNIPQPDWRVRLSLAPEAKYLYAGPNPGILAPLWETRGVLFPYTPAISVSYAANYEATNIVHSNYKIFQYTNSSVDQVSINCDFTCQDTFEANYLLAVIHFFRSMTKMFYGQDQNPKAGTPPPLCYMYGMGSFQFAAHPLAISGFTYSLPNDVDYIQTASKAPAGTQNPVPKTNSGQTTSQSRLTTSGVAPGGTQLPPDFSQPQTGNQAKVQGDITWVPTKIQLSITCIPIISRNTISNRFSLDQYASGNLLNGTRQVRTGGGLW